MLGLFKTITQFLDSDWPANILAGLHFRAQENGLMSPDSVCAISAGLAGHETSFYWSGFAYQNLCYLTETKFRGTLNLAILAFWFSFIVKFNAKPVKFMADSFISLYISVC